jgi:hypothetical protein
MSDAETALARKFKVPARVLDERTRRLVAAAEAEFIGFGGVTSVARGQRIRRKGAARKKDHRSGRIW